MVLLFLRAVSIPALTLCRNSVPHFARSPGAKKICQVFMELLRLVSLVLRTLTSDQVSFDAFKVVRTCCTVPSQHWPSSWVLVRVPAIFLGEVGDAFILLYRGHTYSATTY